MIEKCREWEIGLDPAGLALKLKITVKARPSMGSPTKGDLPPTPKQEERAVYLTEKVRSFVCLFACDPFQNRESVSDFFFVSLFSALRSSARAC